MTYICMSWVHVNLCYHLLFIMHEISPKLGLENAAWIKIPTKLKAQQLYHFCCSLEALFRLNPYLTLHKWKRLGEKSIRVKWENHSNENVYQVDTCIDLHKSEFEICARYQSGNKRETYFIVEPERRGSVLTIIDNYGASRQTEEVDKSIYAWGHALKRFFNHYFYLRHIPFAEKIIECAWIRLSPTARRIVYILLVITFIEVIALVLFVLLMLFV